MALIFTIFNKIMQKNSNLTKNKTNFTIWKYYKDIKQSKLVGYLICLFSIKVVYKYIKLQ